MEFALPSSKKDTAMTETKIEFYKRIQAAREAMKKQPKPKNIAERDLAAKLVSDFYDVKSLVNEPENATE